MNTHERRPRRSQYDTGRMVSLRLTEGERDLLNDARRSAGYRPVASYSRRTLSEFIRDAAVREARRLLELQERNTAPAAYDAGECPKCNCSPCLCGES